MRPRGTCGEVRKALSEAAQALAGERSAASWRDMAQRAGVGYSKARETVKDMVRAGQLERVGAEKRAHSRNWVALYAPAVGLSAQPQAAPPPIDAVMRAWR
jgi:hypothetical protein